MKKPTYLNCILTVLAILLSALVWLNIADRPMLADEAAAQSPSHGVPNAAAQRLAIREAVDEVRKEVTKLNKLLGEGKLKVEVKNLKDFAGADAGDE